jgi:hypothetical protein
MEAQKIKNAKRRVILHLCADIGSDSRYYQLDDNYKVILIGEKIGVENYAADEEIYGIIANPVCTEFSTANNFSKVGNLEKGMFLVRHCQRIIKECNPKFWVIENPFNGRLKEFLGTPNMIYQPWEFGSPWTKKTALWGNFNKPIQSYKNWNDVLKLDLYVRPRRIKPSLAAMHKSAINLIPEFFWAKDKIKNDADFRSICSQGFAKAFYEANP